MKRLFVILPLAVCFVIVFSGQQRNTPQRSVRTPPARPTAPTPPVVKTPKPFPLVALRPDDLVWPPPGQGDRSVAPQSIALLGDTRSEELYVIRTKIPRGKQIVPHVHADSRSVVVISGTYYYGIGESFDASELRAFPPGSFLTEPAGMPHYSWAKDDDVILHVTAVGPSSTRVLPDEPPADAKNLVQKTELFIAAMKTPLDMFHLHVGRYPTTDEGLSALSVPPASLADPSKWDGPYVKEGVSFIDPWGNSYQYEYPVRHTPGRYDLWSAGPDGISDTEDDICSWK